MRACARCSRASRRAHARVVRLRREHADALAVALDADDDPEVAVDELARLRARRRPRRRLAPPARGHDHARAVELDRLRGEGEQRRLERRAEREHARDAEPGGERDGEPGDRAPGRRRQLARGGEARGREQAGDEAARVRRAVDHRDLPAEERLQRAEEEQVAEEHAARRGVELVPPAEHDDGERREEPHDGPRGADGEPAVRPQRGEAAAEAGDHVDDEEPRRGEQVLRRAAEEVERVHVGADVEEVGVQEHRGREAPPLAREHGRAEQRAGAGEPQLVARDPGEVQRDEHRHVDRDERDRQRRAPAHRRRRARARLEQPAREVTGDGADLVVALGGGGDGERAQPSGFSAAEVARDRALHEEALQLVAEAGRADERQARVPQERLRREVPTHRLQLEQRQQGRGVAGSAHRGERAAERGRERGRALEVARAEVSLGVLDGLGGAVGGDEQLHALAVELPRVLGVARRGDVDGQRREDSIGVARGGEREVLERAAAQGGAAAGHEDLPGAGDPDRAPPRRRVRGATDARLERVEEAGHDHEHEADPLRDEAQRGPGVARGARADERREVGGEEPEVGQPFLPRAAEEQGHEPRRDQRPDQEGDEIVRHGGRGRR